MKPMVKLTGRWVALGVMCLLGSQAQAGGLPACTEAQADLTALELLINGNFSRCNKPSVWLGQANGGYESLGAPLEMTKVSIRADLSNATVVEGATQNVVVKCGKTPRCEIDVAFQGECQDCSGAPVAKTGQTTSYAAGDDGSLQKGVAWPNPRFTDNGDGTVTDNLTGLIWLKNANCFDTQIWTDALAAANTLNTGECGLTDGSAEGAWRLPNIKELQSLVDYGQYEPPLPSGHPFSGVQSSYYWSSSTYADSANNAWSLYLNFGSVGLDVKPINYFVWPVRGGQ